MVMVEMTMMMISSLSLIVGQICIPYIRGSTQKSCTQVMGLIYTPTLFTWTCGKPCIEINTLASARLLCKLSVLTLHLKTSHVQSRQLPCKHVLGVVTPSPFRLQLSEKFHVPLSRWAPAFGGALILQESDVLVLHLQP